MVLKYHISPYPTLLENMVVKIWEAANDGLGAEVFTQIIPERNGAGVPTPGAGHQVPYTLTANGLDKVVHIVRMYSAISAVLLHEYNVEPVSDIVTIFDPIRFKIGDGQPNTPAVDTDTYTNILLAGLGNNDYLVHRNGYGFLIPDVHYIADGANNKFVLDPPDVFNADEEFLILRKTKITSVVVNDSVVGKWFAGFVDVAANTNYSSTHLRKLIRFAGTCTYTFAALDAIPVGYAFVFTHLGVYAGAGGVGTVSFLNAPLKWGNTTKASLDIPSFTEACFVYDGTQWNVVYFTDSRFANAAPTLQPLQVVGCGNFSVGDVPGGDPTYEIIHNLNIPGDYNVILSIKSNSSSTAFRNNKICSTWYHHATNKPNRFYVSLQEISGETQDLSISWLLIKL